MTGPQDNRDDTVLDSDFEAAFVRILVERGHATLEQIDNATTAVREMGDLGIRRDIAEVVVERGLITADQAQAIKREASGTGPRRIGDYELISKLGEGGMGVVYKARQLSLDRVVALKLLPARLAADPDFVARFQREARMAARLVHPNVVLALDVGEDCGARYFAMEFVEGRDVGSYLKKEGRFQEREALRIVREIAKALDCAWSHSLIHRDIKPDNILVTTSGTVKLADLGLARLTDDSARVTAAGVAVGTPHYISPEQARGESQIDIRTDIYSLGVTLYHMVAGRPPFGGSSAAVVITRRLTEDPPPARSFAPELSEAAERVIRRMMAREREDRYDTPKELVADLDRVMSGLAPAAALPPRPVPGPDVRFQTPAAAKTPATFAPSRRRRKSWTLLVAAMLLVGLAAAGTLGVLFGLPALAVYRAERTADSIRAQAASGAVDAALDRARQAAGQMRGSAGEPILADLIKELEREKARLKFETEAALALAETERLFASGRIDDALAKLSAAAHRYEGSSRRPEFAEIERKIAERIAAREALAARLAAVDSLAADGRSDDALAVAKALAEEYRALDLAGPAEQVVARIERELAATRAQSAAYERKTREARERLSAVEAILRRKAYQSALSEAALAAERYADTPVAGDFRELAARAERALADEAALAARYEALVEDSRRAAAEGRHADSVAALERAAEIKPDAEISRQIADAKFRLHLANSTEAERARDFRAAADHLRAAVAIRPSRALGARLDELERAAAVAETIEQARAASDAGDFRRARELYARARSRAEGEERDRISRAMEQVERAQAHASALGEARTHFAARRWADAERAALRALDAVPDEADASELLESVRRVMREERE